MGDKTEYTITMNLNATAEDARLLLRGCASYADLLRCEVNFVEIDPALPELPELEA